MEIEDDEVRNTQKYRSDDLEAARLFGDSDGESNLVEVKRERDPAEENDERDSKRKRIQLIGIWVAEIIATNEEQDEQWYALDDVRGGELKVIDVKRARTEEVDYMISRGIWEECPIQDSVVLRASPIRDRPFSPC